MIHLVRTQHVSGRWGDYEQYYGQFGKYLDVQGYLHTILVVTQVCMYVCIIYIYYYYYCYYYYYIVCLVCYIYITTGVISRPVWA